MQTSMAAGPKTETAESIGCSGRVQQAVEDQIAALSTGVADCLQNARAAATEDDFGRMRSDERADAVKIVSATAELLQALGRLKGEFRHDHRVTRVDPSPGKPKLKLGWSGKPEDLLTQAEYDALNEWEQEDYDRWTDGLPPKFGGWKKKEQAQAVTANWVQGELDDVYAQIQKLERRLPLPPENPGSNADAGKS